MTDVLDRPSRAVLRRPVLRLGPNWLIVTILVLISAPLVLMYVYLVVDSFTTSPAGAILPDGVTLQHWRFLTGPLSPNQPTIWTLTFNTFVFASVTALVVSAISLTAAYALSRLDMPARRMFLGGLIVLHAFPTVTLIVAVFLILQYFGLYDTLWGVILVKCAFELPFGVWIMKGFYDTVPWEIEMAGMADGASRARVWWELVLPQVNPGLAAILIFSFLSAWSEFVLPLVLAPGNAPQLLSTYLASLVSDVTRADFGLYKAVGLFYALPVIVVYLVFHKRLLNIYSGGTKG
ncbi:MAG: carbohydrate ABC transporter permease [Pseudomonadota bacterium]